MLQTSLTGKLKISAAMHSPEIFDILHPRDFNPNSKDFIAYKEEVNIEDLPSTLVQLCDYFYDIQTSGSMFSPIKWDANEDVNDIEAPVFVHQCKHCQTVYDREYGDSLNNIKPGTPFKDLPETYCCQMCDAPKSEFVEVDKKALIEFN